MTHGEKINSALSEIHWEFTIHNLRISCLTNMENTSINSYKRHIYIIAPMRKGAYRKDDIIEKRCYKHRMSDFHREVFPPQF